MQIGEVIRKYRKEKNMTQEEMANRLGVTAPAVNKWENGNSMPDIALLAPIARLLDIALDTLLSFRGELTDKEINDLVKTASDRLANEPFETVFQWAKTKMEQYPNCEHLLLWMTVTLDCNRIVREVPDAEKYDAFIKNTLERLLNSKEEYVKTTAADSLYGFYMRKEQYEKAETYLEYFSVQNPERKRKQAVLYEKSGRMEEAYKIYEEILFSEYQILNMVLASMQLMSLKEENYEKAEYIVEKQKGLAELFEMGEYNKHAMELELLLAKQDVEGTLNCVNHLLSSVEHMTSYCSAELYEHMKFKDISPEFIEEMKEKLREAFGDENRFGYMKDDERWKELLQENA